MTYITITEATGFDVRDALDAITDGVYESLAVFDEGTSSADTGRSLADALDVLSQRADSGLDRDLALAICWVLGNLAGHAIVNGACHGLSGAEYTNELLDDFTDTIEVTVRDEELRADAAAIARADFQQCVAFRRKRFADDHHFGDLLSVAALDAHPGCTRAEPRAGPGPGGGAAGGRPCHRGPACRSALCC